MKTQIKFNLEVDSREDFNKVFERLMVTTANFELAGRAKILKAKGKIKKQKKANN